MSKRFVTLDDAVRLLQAASSLDPRNCESLVNWAVTQDGCRIRRGQDGYPFYWSERDNPPATGAMQLRASFDPYTAGFAKSDNSAFWQVSEWDKFRSDSNTQVDFDEVCSFLEKQEGLKLSIRTTKKGDRGRPAKYPWGDFKVALGAKIHADGLPDSTADAPTELVEWAQKWFTDNNYDEPAASSIEPHVAHVVKAHRSTLD